MRYQLRKPTAYCERMYTSTIALVVDIVTDSWTFSSDPLLERSVIANETLAFCLSTDSREVSSTIVAEFNTFDELRKTYPELFI